MATAAALRLALPRLPISLQTLNLFSPSLLSASPPNPNKPLRPLSLSFSSHRLFCSSASPLIPSAPQIDQETKEIDEEQESIEEASAGGSVVEVPQQLLKFAIPTLSVKERKELASYAHGLGKKLKSQQVGKSGVTPSVAAAFVENLESNELLKLKIHGSCPGELIHVIKQLEEATGSVAVDQIGRTVILYRPSITKMKKKKSLNLGKSKEFPAFRSQKKEHTPRESSERRHQLHRT